MQTSAGLILSMPTPIDHPTASQTERKYEPALGRNLLIPPPTWRVVFCVWPICPVTRLTDLAGMKQFFGARPVRSYLLSTHWIVANHEIEDGTSVSAAGKTSRPTEAMTIELPDRTGDGRMSGCVAEKHQGVEIRSSINLRFCKAPTSLYPDRAPDESCLRIVLITAISGWPQCWAGHFFHLTGAPDLFPRLRPSSLGFSQLGTRRRPRRCQATRGRPASLAAHVTPILPDLPLTAAFSRSKATQRAAALTGQRFSLVLTTTGTVIYRQSW